MTLPTTNISPLNGFYSSADIQKIEKGNMLHGRGFEQNLMVSLPAILRSI